MPPTNQRAASPDNSRPSGAVRLSDWWIPPTPSSPIGQCTVRWGSGYLRHLSASGCSLSAQSNVIPPPRPVSGRCVDPQTQQGNPFNGHTNVPRTAASDVAGNADDMLLSLVTSTRRSKPSPKLKLFNVNCSVSGSRGST